MKPPKFKAGDYAKYKGTYNNGYGKIGVIVKTNTNVIGFRFLDSKCQREYNNAKYIEKYDAYEIDHSWLEYHIPDVIEF